MYEVGHEDHPGPYPSLARRHTLQILATFPVIGDNGLIQRTCTAQSFHLDSGSQHYANGYDTRGLPVSERCFTATEAIIRAARYAGWHL